MDWVTCWADSRAAVTVEDLKHWDWVVGIRVVVDSVTSVVAVDNRDTGTRD